MIVIADVQIRIPDVKIRIPDVKIEGSVARNSQVPYVRTITVILPSRGRGGC